MKADVGRELHTKPKKQNFLSFIKKIIYRIKNTVYYSEIGIDNKKLSDSHLIVEENMTNPHKNKKYKRNPKLQKYVQIQSQ